MANPFYSAFNNSNGSNIFQMLHQLKSNPAQFLMSRGLNVPQNIMNDPQAIMQHLLSTGKVNQQQVNEAYQNAMMFKN